MSRFMKTQTETYRSAVAALAKLIEEDGFDSAQRAAAEALSDSMRDSVMMGGMVRGGKPLRLSAAHPCIARLMGKRCQVSMGTWPTTERPPCYPPGADHNFLTLLGGRADSFITHPYSLDTPTLKQMTAFMEKWGLEVTIDGFSWHFPGRTVRVIWRRPGQTT